jgi:hypothetical protein
MDATTGRELLALFHERLVATRAVSIIGERHGMQAMEQVAAVFHELWAEEDARVAARANAPALDAPDACVQPPAE